MTELSSPLAVGGRFAGLALSRDSKRVRVDRDFETMFRFFGPFFFVGVGLAVVLGPFGSLLALGGTLLAAVAVEIAGAALPCGGADRGCRRMEVADER